MISDNTHRIHIPEGEVRELASSQGLLWERAVSKIAARLEQAYVTRNNGIKGLKAYGGTPVKHKADKLWGRYVPCEYINIPLGGYLEFDVTNTQDTRWLADMKYVPATPSQNYPWIGGFRTYVDGTGVAKQIIEVTHERTGRLFVQYADNSEVCVDVPSPFTSRDRHVYERNANKVLIDGTVVNTETAETFTGTEKLKIGAILSSGGISANFTGNCYKVQCWKDGTHQDIDAIPVKDVVDNVYGLWDRVNNKFYGNAGTGAFSGGELIQPISYAESDGTAYVDTGIIPTTFDYTITYEGAIKTLSGGPNTAWGFMGNSGNLPRWVCGTYTNKYLLNANTTRQLDGTADTDSHTFVGKVYMDGDTPKWSSELDGVVKQNGITLDSPQTWETNTLSIYLFARHNADGAGNYAPATMKRWICEKNGGVIKHYIPVRIGTTVELLDLVSWSFATRVGTFTAGADIPYSQLCPDIIEVNTGDIGYGQYGKNLFDKSLYDGHGWYGASGKIADAPNVNATVVIRAIPNKTYYFKHCSVIGGARVMYTTEENWGVNSSCDFLIERPVTTQPNVVSSFTVPSDAKWIFLLVGRVDSSTTATIQEQLNEFMLSEEVLTAETPYEPYHFGIHTDGQHKLIVGEQGVVDLGTLSWDKQSTHGIWRHDPTTGKASGVTNLLMVGTNYSLTDASTISSMADMTYKGHATATAIYIRDDNAYDNMTAEQFKASLSGKLLFYQRTTDSAYIAPQIKDIPMLLSADSNTDVQSGVKTEAWGIKVLDGTESGWQKISGNNVYYNYIALSEMKTCNPPENGLSTHFVGTNEATASMPDYSVKNTYATNSGGSQVGAVAIKINSITTVDDFKSWLASEYAKGTPVIILYPLASPATEQVTIAPVTSVRRTTYVADSDSELGKLNVTTEYLGK